jgi:hypothetical protein
LFKVDVLKAAPNIQRDPIFKFMKLLSRFYSCEILKKPSFLIVKIAAKVLASSWTVLVNAMKSAEGIHIDRFQSPCVALSSEDISSLHDFFPPVAVAWS